jgi:hypothetical protein
VAFLAEYDALPGIGHGCGHHLIAAASVGAALATAATATESDDIEVLLIGTPSGGDDRGQGRDGRRRGLRRTRRRAHVPRRARVAHGDEQSRLSVRRVVFGGRASHAVASPEAGVNALEAMLDLFLAARELRARFGPSGVRLPGVMLEGGVRANIVPTGGGALLAARADERSAPRPSSMRFSERSSASRRRPDVRRLVRPVDNPYDEMRTNIALAARCARSCPRARPRERCAADEHGIDRRRQRREARTDGARLLPAAPVQLPLHTREFGEATAGGRCAGALETASAAMARPRCASHGTPAARERATSTSRLAAARESALALLTAEPEERVTC